MSATGTARATPDPAPADGKSAPPAYADLPRPIVRLLVLLVPLVAAAIGAIRFGHVDTVLPLGPGQDRISTVAFLTNLLAFLGFWAVYFASQHGALRCQSLRALLATNAAQWDPNPQGRTDAYRSKGKSTVTAQAIFIATSAFIIGAIATSDPILHSVQTASFEGLAVQGALAASIGSFTLLLISTEAIESMFNSFKTNEDVIVARFYRISSRIKYYGFVMAFLAVALFVFAISPYLASVALVLFLTVGYSYWYPDFRPPEVARREIWRFALAVLAANAAVQFGVA